RDETAGGLSLVEGKLDLLRDDHAVLLRLRVQRARDGTEVAAGTNEPPRANAIVNDPRASLAPNHAHRGLGEHGRAGAVEQVVIELAPADAITDHRAELGLAAPPVDRARTKRGER